MNIKSVLFISLVFTIALMTSISGDPIGLRIPDTTAVLEEFVNIPIFADTNLTDEGVYSYQLQISYVADLLQVNSVVVSGTIGESFGMPVMNTTISGQVTIAAAGTNPLSGVGILIYIRVKPLRNGGSPFSFTTSLNNFFNEGTPSLILNSGFIQIGPILDITEINQISHEYRLFQNHPNPFNSITIIKYDIPNASDVTLTIYNMNGQMVERLVNQKQEPGFYSVNWDARNVSTGVYFYRIQTDGFQQVKKMLLIK